MAYRCLHSKKRLMFKPYSIFCCVSLWIAAVSAQPEDSRRPNVSVEPTQSASDADLQKRRSALRDALLAQQEKSYPSESVARRSPELSAPERARLRQQLREQGR